MNDKMFCFIICSNNALYTQECLYYINQLNVPEGYEIDVLTVEGARSMTAGYNEGMHHSDAKYKAYLHQDVFIINRDFIQDCLNLFRQDEKIGMIGNIGARKLHESGVMWNGERCGKLYEQHIWESVLYSGEEEVEKNFSEVEVIDGFLMVTQYDIEWREDLFDKWDFYDCSQSMEFIRHGYKVAVPYMDEPWCVHDCGLCSIENYEGERRKFIKEYQVNDKETEIIAASNDWCIRENSGRDEILSKYDKLIEYVNGHDWENAVKELGNLQVTQVDDTLAILAGTICLQFGELDDAYEYIRKGLQYNFRNYELYFLLGNYYESINPYQAWLCYENAEFYCDRDEDRGLISQYKSRIECEGRKPRQTSIVILSYNMKDICIQCIESIRRNNPKSAYEIVVVDNASSDGVQEWLLEQKDIVLICNEENLGFPAGCNQGIEASQPGNDILLLNNDTIMFPNSLFWLRMGLYEEETVGAAGSVCNYAGNEQTVKQRFTSMEEVVEYAITHNIPEKRALEKKTWLIGFAMLLNRKALDEVGLLDTLYSPGSYEDNDIGVRLRYAGWKVYLCHNSFIYHYGSGAGQNRRMWNGKEAVNAIKFKEKWGFDPRYYNNVRTDFISLIKRGKEEVIRVLEIGCGGGATLARIQYQFPNAEVKGIELVEDVARLGTNQIDIIQGNIETMQLPYAKDYFDYIMFGDVLEHLYAPDEVLRKMKPYLREGGQFLCSIPNLMHKSVILPLLRGQFQYEEAGILDRTHIRFFTLSSIIDMLHRCGLVVTDLSVKTVSTHFSEEDQELLDALYSLPHIANKELYEAYQFVFSAAEDGHMQDT